MEILPEGKAITSAIAANDSEGLVLAVKEYARITRNPYLNQDALNFGPSIPVSATLLRSELLENRSEEAAHSWLIKERQWLGGLFYNTGNDCRIKGRYDLALTCYRESARHDPNPSVFNNMAATYKRMGDYRATMDCHLQNICDYPQYAPAYGRLAIILSAYDLSSEKTPIEYLKEYFQLGGTKIQLQGFVIGTPPSEAMALEKLTRQMTDEDADVNKLRQQSKNKQPKHLKDRFGRR